jgi:hypothetical protein
MVTVLPETLVTVPAVPRLKPPPPNPPAEKPPAPAAPNPLAPLPPPKAARSDERLPAVKPPALVDFVAE